MAMTAEEQKSWEIIAYLSSSWHAPQQGVLAEARALTDTLCALERSRIQLANLEAQCAHEREVLAQAEREVLPHLLKLKGAIDAEVAGLSAKADVADARPPRAIRIDDDETRLATTTD